MTPPQLIILSPHDTYTLLFFVDISLNPVLQAFSLLLSHHSQFEKSSSAWWRKKILARSSFDVFPLSPSLARSQTSRARSVYWFANPGNCSSPAYILLWKCNTDIPRSLHAALLFSLFILFKCFLHPQTDREPRSQKQTAVKHSINSIVLWNKEGKKSDFSSKILVVKLEGRLITFCFVNKAASQLAPL